MAKKSKKNKAKGLWALLMVIAALLYYIIGIADIEVNVDVPGTVEKLVEEQIATNKEKLQEKIASAKKKSTPHAVADKKSPTGKKAQIKGQLEIPALEKQGPSQLLSYKGFTVSYNNNTRLPNWVAYELTATEVAGDLPRKDKFRPDPAVQGPQANKDDYRNSGWDRGHMAPAADMKWSMEAMEESCYFTNICPQNPQLNGGDWKELEEQCRKWAQKYGSIYIACGPIVTKNEHGKIGANKVVVPDKFYKVILARVNGEYQGVGFIFHNSPLRKSKISGKPPVNKPLKSYAVTIDEVEAVTGIDFFQTLDAATQNRVEKLKVMF